MFQTLKPSFLILMLTVLPGSGASADELQFPQVVRTHYEAKAPEGGQLHVWMEREKASYGLDPKLYPGARMVDITQITPAPGSTTLTYIEVTTTASSVPDYIYVSGNVRFRVSGMVLKSSNFPPGLGMAPKP